MTNNEKKVVIVVTMIFEMTRDYDIVMPMIVAVVVGDWSSAFTLACENIFIVKLVSRRHFIPKAIHANMFLVHRVSDVMDPKILLLPTETSLNNFCVRRPGTLS